MHERPQQKLDNPQLLDEYFRKRGSYDSLSFETLGLIRIIDRQNPELDSDEKLTVLFYLFWIQDPNCNLIADYLGEEVEFVQERVDKIMLSSDNEVCQAISRLAGRDLPFPSLGKTRSNISPELKKQIIKMREEGIPNDQIKSDLGLKGTRLSHIIHELISSGVIEPRKGRKKIR